MQYAVRMGWVGPVVGGFWALSLETLQTGRMPVSSNSILPCTSSASCSVLTLRSAMVRTKVQCDERDAVLFCDQCKDFFCQGCFAPALDDNNPIEHPRQRNGWRWVHIVGHQKS